MLNNTQKEWNKIIWKKAPLHREKRIEIGCIMEVERTRTVEEKNYVHELIMQIKWGFENGKWAQKCYEVAVVALLAVFCLWIFSQYDSAVEWFTRITNSTSLILQYLIFSQFNFPLSRSYCYIVVFIELKMKKHPTKQDKIMSSHTQIIFLSMHN